MSALAIPQFSTSGTRRVMQRRSVSVRELARRLEHSGTGQINRWLNGRTTPGFENLHRIAVALDVSVEDLCEVPDA